MHLAIDNATLDIGTVEFTTSSDCDSLVLPELLDQIPEDEENGTVPVFVPLKPVAAIQLS